MKKLVIRFKFFNNCKKIIKEENKNLKLCFSVFNTEEYKYIVKFIESLELQNKDYNKYFYHIEDLIITKIFIEDKANNIINNKAYLVYSQNLSNNIKNNLSFPCFIYKSDNFNLDDYTKAIFSENIEMTENFLKEILI